MRKPKIKTIDIQAKEWFDRISGNSYFAAVVTINFGLKTQQSFKVQFQYGYGNQYEYTAFQELQKLGFIPKQQNSLTPPWSYYEQHNIIVRHNITRGCLKRDVVNI